MKRLFSFIFAALFAVSMMADTFVLVTVADSLSAGDSIIIVNADKNKAISTTQATNNRTATSVSSLNDSIDANSDVQIIVLEASSTNWKFKVGDDQYLYAASNSSNHLKTSSSKTAGNNGIWSVDITNTGMATITAQGSNSRKLMRYNPNGSNPIFSCYATNSTTGTLVRIYKKDGTASEPTPEPEPEPDPVVLGEKTISEFLTLKNTKDTCILTGVVTNIVMDKTDPTVYNKYGNFDLYDETDTVYVYGLLTAEGESEKFRELDVDANDTLTIKAVYGEYKGKPEAINAVFVSVKKYVEPPVVPTDIINVEHKAMAIKRFKDGQILIERNDGTYTVMGTRVK